MPEIYQAKVQFFGNSHYVILPLRVVALMGVRRGDLIEAYCPGPGKFVKMVKADKRKMIARIEGQRRNGSKKAK